MMKKKKMMQLAGGKEVTAIELKSNVVCSQNERLI